MDYGNKRGVKFSEFSQNESFAVLRRGDLVGFGEISVESSERIKAYFVGNFGYTHAVGSQQFCCFFDFLFGNVFLWTIAKY